MNTTIPPSRASGLNRVLIPLLLLLLVCIPVAIFVENPLQPLLERHTFRQTQTALTAYWLAQGGEFFRYLTPVLGHPWLVPMELPIFQSLVATLSSLFGWPLDFTGRLVSLVFFVLSAVPIAWCLRRYGWPAVIVAIALLFSSPVNVFYSRTFLIETMATALALGALGLYIGFIRTRRSSFLIGFVLCGALAGLQKITTFLPVFGVCCLDLLWSNLPHLRRATWRAIDPRPLVAMAAAMILPAWWTLYSDALKETGPLSVMMTAEKLRDFNFGTLAQRLDISTWQLVFYDRVFLYGGLSVGILILGIAALRKKFLMNREVALFAGAGMLGPLVFFNLHWVHDYYQLGCLAFFACAIGIAASPLVTDLLAGGWPRFVALVIAIVGVNLFFFQQRYLLPLQRTQSGSQVAYEIATWLKQQMAGRDVVVVFGMQWSSVIPYYSERYGLVVPDDTPQRAEILGNLRAFTGEREIGSIVYCRDGRRPEAQVRQEMDTLFRQIDGPIARSRHCTLKLRAARTPAPTG